MLQAGPHTQRVANGVTHFSAVQGVEVEIFHAFTAQDLHHVHRDIRPNQLAGFRIVIQAVKHL